MKVKSTKSIRSEFQAVAGYGIRRHKFSDKDFRAEVRSAKENLERLYRDRPEFSNAYNRVVDFAYSEETEYSFVVYPYAKNGDLNDHIQVISARSAYAAAAVDLHSRVEVDYSPAYAVGKDGITRYPARYVRTKEGAYRWEVNMTFSMEAVDSLIEDHGIHTWEDRLVTGWKVLGEEAIADRRLFGEEFRLRKCATAIIGATASNVAEDEVADI